MLPDGCEHLADEVFGSPVSRHDTARRPANPDQLSRNKFWLRRQHSTDETHHEVERCVGKIQRLCIAFLRAHISAFGMSAGACLPARMGGSVNASHAHTGVGSRNRDLPCATTHVEHARTRRHPQAGQKLECTWLKISA